VSLTARDITSQFWERIRKLWKLWSTQSRQHEEKPWCSKC